MVKPIFDKGPLTYFATTIADGGNIRAGQLVYPSPNVAGFIKPTIDAAPNCLGVAMGNASGSDFANADATDAWGATVVNAQYPPNEVSVGYQGVWKLAAAGAAEVQTVTIGGSGLVSFTLTFTGQTTGAISATASAAAVQSALEALSNLAPGDVTVTGVSGGPYTVTFGGAYAGVDVAQMTATPTGGTGTVTVATSTAGSGFIAFGALVTAAANGLVAPFAGTTYSQIIGRCIDTAGIGIGRPGKVLLGGIGA